MKMSRPTSRRFVLVYGPGYSYNAKDSATITITDGGKATDADGLLTGPGLSKTGVGTYSLGPDYVYNIQNELHELSFQTVALAAEQHPEFELDVTDTTSNLTTKDLTRNRGRATARIIARRWDRSRRLRELSQCLILAALAVRLAESPALDAPNFSYHNDITSCLCCLFDITSCRFYMTKIWCRNRCHIAGIPP
jgi:hypothetical protein